VEDVSNAEDMIETMAGTRAGSSAVAVEAVVAGVLGSFSFPAAVGVGLGVEVTPNKNIVLSLNSMFLKKKKTCIPTIGGRIATGPALPW
jgi:hypothetical protein